MSYLSSPSLPGLKPYPNPHHLRTTHGGTWAAVTTASTARAAVTAGVLTRRRVPSLGPWALTTT